MTVINAADTAFMIASTGLVLMMTLPGLALFYAGMVAKKNLLDVMAQSVGAVAIVSPLWLAAGYSLAFAGDGAWIGSLVHTFMHGVGMNTISPHAKTIPELLYVAYQMTFAAITCALVGGAVVGRMRFSAFCLFSGVWLFVVYVPVAHWVWGGGFLGANGLLDFAGGTVVHTTAGMAGLTAALVLGARRGFRHESATPFDLTIAVIGTGLLWVGWFGFNGGSALSPGSRAVFAIVDTHIAACAGVAVWTGIEWAQRGKPSVLGMISGAVAGLATITPASGFVLPWQAFIIGAAGSAVCYWFCTVVKERFKYDDTLNVFGVHGVGGILGTLLTGIFATAALSVAPNTPNGIPGLLEGNPRQFLIQAIGVSIVIAWSLIGTWVTLKIVGSVFKLRVGPTAERDGLDFSEHGDSLPIGTFSEATQSIRSPVS